MHGTQPPGEQPPAYGPPPGYGQPGYGPPPGYAPPGYGPQPGYGPPGYGGPPWYGPQPGWGPAPQPGSTRPGSATAAAVLGFVTGGLTALFALLFLVPVLRGTSDPTFVVLALGGIPCAAALITGAVWVLQRRSARLLFGSALAAVAVLVLTLLIGVGVYADHRSLIGLSVFVLPALALPVVTACLAGRRDVTRWVDGQFSAG